MRCLPAYSGLCDQVQNTNYRIHPALVISISVFPISFSVNAAYQRREQALQLLARLKACMLNIYLLHRCWANQPGLPADFLDCSRLAVVCCYQEMRAYLMADSEVAKVRNLWKVYDYVAEVRCALTCVACVCSCGLHV